MNYVLMPIIVLGLERVVYKNSWKLYFVQIAVLGVVEHLAVLGGDLERRHVVGTEEGLEELVRLLEDGHLDIFEIDPDGFAEVGDWNEGVVVLETDLADIA